MLDKLRFPFSKARLNASEIQRLISYLRAYRKRGAVAVVSVLFGAALGLVFPLVMKNLVDTVLKRGNIKALNNIALLLGITFLIRAVFNYIQSYLLTYIGERIVYDLRTSLYDHLQELSLDRDYSLERF